MTQVNSPDPASAGRDESRRRDADERAPQVAQSPAAQPDVRLVEDPYIGVRAEHTVPPAGPLPPEQASHAGEIMSGQLDEDPAPEQPSPPTQDVKITPEQPSVWEAAGEAKE